MGVFLVYQELSFQTPAISLWASLPGATTMELELLPLLLRGWNRSDKGAKTLVSVWGLGPIGINVPKLCSPVQLVV